MGILHTYKKQACIITGSVILLVMGAIWSRVLLINASLSMPRGIWRHDKGHMEGPHIALTPPAEAMTWKCVRPHQLLLKNLWASQGEVICMEGHTLYKKDQPDTRIQASRTTSSGEPTRLAWQGCKAVPEGQIFVLGQHPSSCDSRFFGFVPADSIVGSVTPLLIWDTLEDMP